jgi:hypothetical protein
MRKIFGQLCFVFCIGFFISAAAQNKSDTVLKWHDLRGFTVEGKGWTETKNFYDRLPAKAEAVVRPQVWNLAENSAGISARFVTDASEISVRWKLRLQNLALSNMPAASVSGVDLYVRDNGKWRWAGNARPNKPLLNEQKIIGNISRQTREFLLYLPLYNGIETIEIGLPENASVSKAEAFSANVKPIVFYGTSIVQGASAARAGMAYPAILSRRLNLPVINLGFSGNCKMEPELADLLTELEASVYLVDCLPNLSSGEEVAQKAPNFIRTIRRRHPEIPIILVENVRYPDIFIEQRKSQIVESKNKSLQKVFADLRKAGVKNLYYIRSENLLGSDGEATVDGIHPTDLGFERMANVFEPILQKILKKK